MESIEWSDPLTFQVVHRRKILAASAK